MRPVPACPSSSRLAGACKGPALHLYIQICACTHTHTHACILIPGYKCIYLLMHTCMHTHTHTHIYIYLYIRTYIYVYMNNTHTHMHICVHTCMHAYACVCVCTFAAGLQLDCSWTARSLHCTFAEGRGCARHVLLPALGRHLSETSPASPSSFSLLGTLSIAKKANWGELRCARALVCFN